MEGDRPALEDGALLRQDLIDSDTGQGDPMIVRPVDELLQEGNGFGDEAAVVFGHRQQPCAVVLELLDEVRCQIPEFGDRLPLVRLIARPVVEAAGAAQHAVDDADAAGGVLAHNREHHLVREERTALQAVEVTFVDERAERIVETAADLRADALADDMRGQAPVA